MNKARLRLWLPFALSAVLVLLFANALRGQADQLSDALSRLSSTWPLLLVAIGLYFVGIWLRSVRWGLLLPEHSVRTTTLFRALVVGFTVNNLLPLRMGEVARTVLLSRWAAVAYTATVASLLVERVLDGLSLAVLLLVALRLEPDPPGYLWAVGTVAGVIFLVLAGVLAVAAWRASALTVIAEFVVRFLPQRFRPMLIDASARFARSLTLVHDPGRLVRLIGLSLVAWCFELGLFFVLMLSLGIGGRYSQALLVGSAANFATLIPSSPGYAGTFDAALGKVAVDTLGISAGLAGAYVILVRATLFIPVILVGTLVLWRSHLSFNQVTHTPQPAADPQVTALTTGV